MSSQGEDVDREEDRKGDFYDARQTAAGDTGRIRLGYNGRTVGRLTSTEADCSFENKRDTDFQAPRSESLYT